MLDIEIDKKTMQMLLLVAIVVFMYMKQMHSQGAGHGLLKHIGMSHCYDPRTGARYHSC